MTSKLKGRIKPGSLAERIVRVYDLDPRLSSYQIAKLCNTEANYVRVVLATHSRKLYRSKAGEEARPAQTIQETAT
jgi:hypothetical protein